MRKLITKISAVYTTYQVVRRAITVIREIAGNKEIRRKFREILDLLGLQNQQAAEEPKRPSRVRTDNDGYEYVRVGDEKVFLESLVEVWVATDGDPLYSRANDHYGVYDNIRRTQPKRFPRLRKAWETLLL